MKWKVVDRSCRGLIWDYIMQEPWRSGGNPSETPEQWLHIPTAEPTTHPIQDTTTSFESTVLLVYLISKIYIDWILPGLFSFHFLFFSSFQCVVPILYAQVTVHRDKFPIKQPTRCIKYPKFILSRNSTCFWHLLCPSSGVICCAHGNWCVSCTLCDRFLAE
jgi:hypothetical protein